jgi:hypothetical protein
MNAQRLALVGLILITSGSLTNAEELTYSNAVGHYSLQLPEGWTESRKWAIDFTNQLNKIVGNKSVQFVAGFELEKHPGFLGPQFLIQNLQTNQPSPSYAELVKQFSSKKTAQERAESTQKMRIMINHASLGEIQVDKKRHMVFLNFEMEITLLGKCKGLIALCLGRQAIAQINFYAPHAAWEENLPVFQSILDSFHYEPGYEYEEFQADPTDLIAEKNWNRFMEKVFSLGGLMVVALAILFFRRRRLKSRSKEV